jgi:predicted anti-sigma-YlaC factor YlaD
MNCEEFATAGLDLGSAESDSLLQKAAREHLRDCSQCAALHENWLTLREDLRVLGAGTADAEAPPRVEMRLRQEFRTRHKTVKRQHAALVFGWSLAAAAALFCAVTWVNWHMHRGTGVAKIETSVINSQVSKQASPSPSQNANAAASELGDLVVASNGADFTLLPDSMPPVSQDSTVVRVQMQRAALEALGLPINEEHADDWIQVDLLVGDDGLPQAVRLPQSTTEATN